MQVERLEPGRTVLLFFDMLNGHVKKDDPAAQKRYKPVIRNAVSLLEAARNTGIIVAYAVANHRPDNATTANIIRDTDNRLRPIKNRPEKTKHSVVSGSWEAEVIDELKPRKVDYIIPKFRWNAFYQTYLDLALRNESIDTIVISGGSTDVGVASTVYAARDMDYNIVVVSDACTSPEKDNHDQFMQRIFPRMARVRNTGQIIDMLSGGKEEK